MYTADQIRTLIAEGHLRDFYNDKYWRRLSHRIIREHHGECQLCKAAHRLTRATLVHHVLHLRVCPELAYSRTYTDETGTHMQLMPLCHDCHERMHARGIYAKRSGYTNEEKW
jgi:5-methylcytosine-specific restriction endonuclease McrA